MSVNEENRERRKKEYYSLTHDIQMMRYKMNEIKRHRGHSPAFKNLMLALIFSKIKLVMISQLTRKT